MCVEVAQNRRLDFWWKLKIVSLIKKTCNLLQWADFEVEVLANLQVNIFQKHIIKDKVFKNGPGEICGRQPLKDFTWAILDYFVPLEKQCFFYRQLTKLRKK